MNKNVQNSIQRLAEGFSLIFTEIVSQHFSEMSKDINSKFEQLQTAKPVAERYIDKSKVAEILDVSDKTVENLANEGCLDRHKIKSSVRYYLPQVMEYAASRKV